ncbi:MAG: hypothetical protein F6K39_30795, partial [Okeania sp. SIO3B3]|nr:hypothetical protein [Okeania sp. SIO3B3]
MLLTLLNLANYLIIEALYKYSILFDRWYNTSKHSADKPVWILLPFVPDWRWLLDRNDSPWYPTARLFRQPKI